MKYFLILDTNGYVTGTEESDSPTTPNTFEVPRVVYDEVRNSKSRVYRVNCGDLECLPVECEIEKLRRSAVNSLVSKMLDELASGVLRVTDNGTYRFKLDDETIAQLTLFSEASTPNQTRFVKALNINTGYFDAVEMAVVDIASLRCDLADRWSTINQKYLQALNAVKASDEAVEIVRKCREMEVKVL